MPRVNRSLQPLNASRRANSPQVILRFAVQMLMARLFFVTLKNMPSRYAQWMYDWEHRLTSVDNNRVVRPLEWGVEWARDWPCRNGWRPGQIARRSREVFRRFQPAHRRGSDEFYSYDAADDFRLEKREVQVFSTREVPDLKA